MGGDMGEGFTLPQALLLATIKAMLMRRIWGRRRLPVGCGHPAFPQALSDRMRFFGDTCDLCSVRAYILMRDHKRLSMPIG